MQVLFMEGGAERPLHDRAFTSLAAVLWSSSPSLHGADASPHLRDSRSREGEGESAATRPQVSERVRPTTGYLQYYLMVIPSSPCLSPSRC